MTEPRTFELDDGSVYERIPAAEFPDGDSWESLDVEERLGPGPRTAAAVTSQNGWSANDRSVIASFTIPGTKTKIALRAGDVSVVILDFLAWWNREMEPIDGSVLDDWGYAERTIRGSTTTLSNHASGTAGDANATRHPLGTYTLTKPQLAKVKARLALYRGALRHGAFYTGRPDEMHVEINAGPALVRAVADDIRAGRIGGGTPTSEEDDMPWNESEWTYIRSMNGKLDRATNASEGVWNMLAGDLSDGADRLAEIWSQDGLGQAEIKKRLDAITARLSDNPGGGVAPIDYDRLAEQVAQKLADRLAT